VAIASIVRQTDILSGGQHLVLPLAEALGAGLYQGSPEDYAAALKRARRRAADRSDGA
jgi:hypothetical protein